MARPRRWAFLFVLGLLAALALLSGRSVAASDEHPTDLPIRLTPDELTRLDEIGSVHWSTPPATPPVRDPGDFEPVTGCIVRYHDVFGLPMDLLVEIAEDVTLWVIVANSSQEVSARNELHSAGANMSNVDWSYHPTDSMWTGDYGPWFIIDGNGEQGIVDPIYNRPRPNDDLIPFFIGDDWGVPSYGMDIKHTGGNYMSDGRGVAMSTELVIDENPSLTPARIDSFMHAYLGITRYEKLGYVEGFGSIHHLNCWAKFLSPGKILLKQVDPGHASYTALEARAHELESISSSWGRAYEVVRVYAPNDEPYTNALILNDKVFVPLYGTANDSAALATYGSAMPGYEVLGYTGSWETDDAIRCRTMGVTDPSMLFIDHVPRFDTAETSEDYRVRANIIDHSGQGLVTDSLLVFWRTDRSRAWTPIVMTSAGGDSFFADIPAQPFGTEVAYYIFARDNSGRREHVPYVAPGDAYRFSVIDDSLKPSIEHTQIQDRLPSDWPVTISATITDNVGLASTTIEWTRNGTPQTDIEMARVEGTFSYEGTFPGTVSVGDAITYRIVATDESSNTAFEPSSGTHGFMIVDAISVIVWEPDAVPNSGAALLLQIDRLGVSYDYTTTMPTLSDYRSAFICLGVYPDNYALSTAEADSIVAFLNAGGKVYMEGGDCWAHDPAQTTYNPSFGVWGISDGSSDLSSVDGIDGTMTDGMSFTYTGANRYMDHINPLTGAGRIFTNPADGAGCGVANDAGGYQTVALAFEFDGLQDGADPSTREELMTRILQFFGVYDTGVQDEHDGVIERLALHQNAPNPFNPATELAFELPERADVELAVYDVSGRKVATLVEGAVEAGRHHVAWNGTDDAGRSVASGVYFFRLSRGGETIVRRGVLLK